MSIDLAPSPAKPGASGSAGARTLGGLVRYFLKLGSSGFGGPIALVGYMQRDLVEQRGWFTEAEYRQGLALAQTMPGPRRRGEWWRLRRRQSARMGIGGGRGRRGCGISG